MTAPPRQVPAPLGGSTTFPRLEASRRGMKPSNSRLDPSNLFLKPSNLRLKASRRRIMTSNLCLEPSTPRLDPFISLLDPSIPRRSRSPRTLPGPAKRSAHVGVRSEGSMKRLLPVTSLLALLFFHAPASAQQPASASSRGATLATDARTLASQGKLDAAIALLDAQKALAGADGRRVRVVLGELLICGGRRATGRE